MANFVHLVLFLATNKAGKMNVPAIPGYASFVLIARCNFDSSFGAAHAFGGVWYSGIHYFKFRKASGYPFADVHLGFLLAGVPDQEKNPN